METALVKFSGWRLAGREMGAKYFRVIKGVECLIETVEIVKTVERPGQFPMLTVRCNILERKGC